MKNTSYFICIKQYSLLYAVPNKSSNTHFDLNQITSMELQKYSAQRKLFISKKHLH